MRKLVVVVVIAIAIVIMVMSVTVGFADSWISVKEFDLMVTTAYHGNGMLGGDVTFTAGESVLINVYCDAERIDYRILEDDEWMVENQTLFISYNAVIEMMAASLSTESKFLAVE